MKTTLLPKDIENLYNFQDFSYFFLFDWSILFIFRVVVFDNCTFCFLNHFYKTPVIFVKVNWKVNLHLGFKFNANLNAHLENRTPEELTFLKI